MSKRNVHIVPNKEGGWSVKREGGERPSSTFETKVPAVERGRSLAKNDRAELVIHRKDGTIQDKDSYGSDPCPPVDRRH